MLRLQTVGMEWEDIRTTLDAAETGMFLANQVRDVSGHELDEPVDLDLICKLGGFTVREADGVATFDALLLANENNSFTIVTSIADPDTEVLKTMSIEDMQQRKKQHQKFLICHEIGHSFFYDRQPGRMPLGKVRGGLGPGQAPRYGETVSEEFARQLLVPKENIKGRDCSAEELSDQFDITPGLARVAITGTPMIEDHLTHDEIYKHRVKTTYRYVLSQEWWK